MAWTSSSADRRALRLITDAFSTLPRWVKVFATSREEATIKNQFERFKPMELKVDEERNLKDVELYLRSIARKFVKSSWTFEMIEKDIRAIQGYPDGRWCAQGKARRSF